LCAREKRVACRVSGQFQLAPHILDLDLNLELATRSCGESTRLLEFRPRSLEIPAPNGCTPTEKRELGADKPIS
jgi:hypothetical protein